MKSQKGISIIKLILIVIVAIIAILFIISKISQRMEKAEKEKQKEEERARLLARYEASYNIGDKITTNRYEITVTNIEERTKVGIPKYYKTVDDYYYTLVCATIKLKNISNEPQRIYDYRPDFSMYFKLEDDNERTYYNDSTFTTYYQFEFDNLNSTQLTVKPNETVTVQPVFKMDKSKYQNHTFYMNILGRYRISQNTITVKILQKEEIFMEIILFIICVIGSIIIFKNKDKRFPNYPILGWLVCTIILAVGLYLIYNAIDGASRNAAFNAGYRDALK